MVSGTVRRARGAQRGQMLILVAAAVVMLVGTLGLAIDVGMSALEQRTMQNAADAGALAGARVVAKAATTSGLTALTDVQTLVSANHMATGSPTIAACNYVDDNNTALGDCSETVPATATGVQVTVTEQHPTFFIRIVPGGPTTATTGATATAHVQLLANPPGDGPFLVCGVSTKLANGGKMSLVIQSGSGWVLNPAAVGQTFEVQGPQITSCGSTNSSYKGDALGSANEGRSVPSWFTYTTGDAAGQIQASVDGIDGCQANTAINNCVVFLPVAVTPPPDNGNNQLWTVAIMAFYITSNGSGNVHYGQLLGAYTVDGGGQQGWTPQYTGPIVVRLTQ